jgi:hypothetical protein
MPARAGTKLERRRARWRTPASQHRRRFAVNLIGDASFVL